MAKIINFPVPPVDFTVRDLEMVLDQIRTEVANGKRPAFAVHAATYLFNVLREDAIPDNDSVIGHVDLSPDIRQKFLEARRNRDKNED